VQNAEILSALEVERILTEEKGRDIFVLDMQGIHGGRLGETLVIVTGTNRRHMLHMAETVRAAARQAVDDGLVPSIEDEDSTDWMLLDLGTVVVHFMSKEGRAYYDLDSFWTNNVEKSLSGKGDDAE
jgi:ribosome-associated protein